MTLTVESWCEALESGKYKQGADALRVGDCFCCLGVACDLSTRGKWEGNEYYLEDDGHFAEFLPAALQDELGIRTEVGSFEFGSLPEELQKEVRRQYLTLRDGTACLTGMNDAGVSFHLIAKVIRARPKGLFREEAQP